MKVDYSKPETPDDYICGTCGATHRKLWRQYQTFAPALLCGACALLDQGKAGPIDGQGYRETEHGRIDQIGWYVPAVPDEEGVGYWGYTSVPDAGVRWWRGLPTE